MTRYRAGLVAIARDENPYLLEWLAYHLAIGFEHVWVYDNASAVPLARVVSRAAAREHVTILRWPDAASGRTQIEAYNHFLRRHGRDVAWAAVIDLDEMICLKQDWTIQAFLDRFDDATGIALNWRFFGSAGHRTEEPGLMMERFRRAAPVEAGINAGVKSLHRLDAVAFLMPHHALYRDREAVVSASGAPVPNDWRIPIDPANFAIAQVNHYFVKSAAEWNRKVARHRRYSADDRDGYFAWLDRNEVEDTAILKHRDDTHAWMRRLQRRPGFRHRLRDGRVAVAAAVRRLARRGR
jgi:hypothetical protein